MLKGKLEFDKFFHSEPLSTINTLQTHQLSEISQRKWHEYVLSASKGLPNKSFN